MPPAASLYPLYATPTGLTRIRFGLVPFRSPLLRDSIFLSSPRATKMFQFARSPPTALFYSDGGNTALPVLGFPIRDPPGQSLLAAHRGSIVASYALHRLSAPRHPPCALGSLVTKENALDKMQVFTYILGESRNSPHHYAVFKVRLRYASQNTSSTATGTPAQRQLNDAVSGLSLGCRWAAVALP